MGLSQKKNKFRDRIGRFYWRLFNIVITGNRLTENDSLIRLMLQATGRIWIRKPKEHYLTILVWLRMTIFRCFPDQMIKFGFVWFTSRCASRRPSEHSAGRTLATGQRHSQRNVRLRMLERRKAKGTSGEFSHRLFSASADDS